MGNLSMGIVEDVESRYESDIKRYRRQREGRLSLVEIQRGLDGAIHASLYRTVGCIESCSG